MDQHDKDWLDLGRQLKDYHPAGDPKEDFQALQELQRQQPDRKTRGLGYWVSNNLLLLVLLPFLGLVAFSLGKGQWERYQRRAAAQEVNFAEVKAVEQALPTQGFPTVQEPSVVPENIAEAANQSLKTGSISPPAKVEEVSKKRSTTLPGMNPSTQDVAVEVVGTNPPAAFAGGSPPMVLLPNQSSDRVEVAVQSLRSAQIFPVSRPMTPLPVIPMVISKQPSNLQITLGMGLSNHWRGANFMQEVDRGIYAYVGIYRSIGRRFGLEGRIGYRGHGMQLPVVSDVDAPWSYHKEEIHNTGNMGEDRAYIYEGVVEGYQAVEFSLMTHYKFSPRLSAIGGVRYSLPDLAFERTVMGPDEENPFSEFIERQPLVEYQDYGALLGFEYHFSRFLALEVGLHLGMVDLIDDAAAGRTRFNHSSSFSFGVKYKLE
jgi:hypothetical protein